MKTRAEVIEGLQWILDSHAAACGPAGDVREFIEPAVVILRGLDHWQKLCLDLYREHVGDRIEGNWEGLMTEAKTKLLEAGLLKEGA